MKVIELLSKIANGEEVPTEIKYNNIDYFWCKQCKIYERLEDDDIDLYNDLDDLNDEVEIIEEEKKIPEKLSILQFSDLIDMSKEELIETIKEQRFKINKIIDYLKSKGE